MHPTSFSRFGYTALRLAMLLALSAPIHAAPPDLTAPGVIATINRIEAYNLGPTGLRGWIYVSRGAGTTHGADGTMTGESRQILVTVAAPPANAELAVDDVILGAMAASSGTVPYFSSDARKAFGAAVGEAEKTGAGTLRVKRWRANAIEDVNIPITIMGEYSDTAPYACPKSSLILANARNELVSQLLAPESTLLSNDWKGSIHALALLAGVQPGDPDYTSVQSRLQTYARARSSAGPGDTSLPIWHWSYTGLFLAEYYLATGDANVLPGIQSFTMKLAQSQTLNGTFGHGPSVLRPDGSGRLMGTGYGPVNSVGIVANMAIVMGKKALLAGGQAIDLEIDGAIQRGSDYFAFYVNKGSIPYGEHEPWLQGHSSNGKDPMCAVFFGLQEDRATETEYFTRMSIAGYRGRETGHTGQGFSYLWGALGANMGGTIAVAEHLKAVRWHLDLVRRTDGSFSYEIREGYGGNTTADGTYLGATSYNGLDPTASYLLTYSLPLKRLYITGKRDVPANPPPLNLDAATVAHAIDAANFKVDSPGFTNARLIDALSDYDPVVRHYAAIELGKTTRTLNTAELTTLRNMATGSNANGRMGACHALGLRNDTTALPTIVQRLDKNTETDLWVRAMAATAIGSYPASTASAHRDTMINHFVSNATDSDVIVWSDPIQMSNTYLFFALFGGPAYYGGNIRDYMPSADKNLLYSAIQVGFNHPDSRPRSEAAKFCFDKLPLADVQALLPDLFKVIQIECLADRMFANGAFTYGIKTLSKHKIREGIPQALAMLEVPTGFEWGSKNYIIPALDELASYGDAARWTLPPLRSYLGKWSLGSVEHTKLVDTIAAIDNAITAPTQIPGLAVADSQVVSTSGPRAITLTGSSPRSAITVTNVTSPAHGTLTGTAPNLTYTPNPGYTGPDSFQFQVVDNLGTAYPSAPGTVSIIAGTPGTGLKGEYFDNMDFTNLKLTRTDAQVNFDWGTGSPHSAIGANTFSVRWNGLLLVPETGTYTFSTLNSDGVRLYVDGVLVLDRFEVQPTKWNDSTPVNLTAGQLVDLHLYYYEKTGSAVAKLKWTGPSFAGANGEIIGSQWLYDGTGMTRTPYAYAQSLTILKNKPLAIPLEGSSGTVSYTIITPPTHGILTGTVPNLTYTPHANFIGLDSFTFKVSNGTSDSAPATVAINVLPANTFSVNFYVGPDWPYGGLTTDEQKENVKLTPTMRAGLADWFTYGWSNYRVPWGPGGPQPPVTLTSNLGSTASFTLKKCRNGYTYNGPRTTLLGDGNGNMMDTHVNSTLDGNYQFDMEVTNIPFAVYDVIFYMGSNKAQFGDGTGVIVFNGGAERAFTLKPGAFDGCFTEMVDATTQGNYMVFKGVTASSFTTQTWGTGPSGYNHIGPFGYQIRDTTTAPTPNPMTFDSPPTASSITSITMTATTASGVHGVEYYFAEITGNPGGSDSGWQDSPVYTDAGLTPGTSYTYTVKARNKPLSKNETADSATASATTDTQTLVSRVWNVNIGNQLTTSDNFIGAAPENSVPNSFWNPVTTANPTELALADATGANIAGVTLTVTGSLGYGNYAPITGPKIFSTWMKSSDNATPYKMVIGGLSSGKTYDLIVYSDWYWKGNGTLPLTQTLGSGLASTVVLDQISTGTNGFVPGLVEDTDPAANTSIEGNWLRINGLTPDENGNLGFSMGGTNAAFSGFQLVYPTGGSTFATWADANNASGQTPDQDHDNDGVENGIEYFMGETGSSLTAMPGLDGTNTITWTMDPAYNGSYEVQTSPDLGTWTNVDPRPLPTGGNLSYTLPSDLGKQFVRLLVMPTP